MISFKDVSLRYDRGAGVKNINFQVRRGEFVYLIGPSGAGKSTLLRMLYMDIFPNTGYVEVDQFNSNTIKRRQIPKLRQKVGMIFQDYKLLNDRDVFQNVALPLVVMGASRRDIDRRVTKTLEEVGLTHRKHYYPAELSGGEQQRVSIARAIAKDPLVLLADEPTGNLDYGVAQEILNLLWRVNAKGTAVFMATHNIELIKNRPARTFRLSHGEFKGELLP
ncbi:MAG: cell division ATP-binding protein FtsE [Lentisphaeria bacterium]|nr:cell division ATP-binding protein FtsE [Candidatus Neomarinimicrobiota bacterium]MCF7842144.1 cell division ATP-binding protein FtsE [Lentisphaeria bacterium]